MSDRDVTTYFQMFRVPFLTRENHLVIHSFAQKKSRTLTRYRPTTQIPNSSRCVTWHLIQVNKWMSEWMNNPQSVVPGLWASLTLMTEVGALVSCLAWSCATLAMLASVLSRFIWPMAMETEAGARLAGIRGCDIIMKGNWSRTGGGKKKEMKI